MSSIPMNNISNDGIVDRHARPQLESSHLDTFFPLKLMQVINSEGFEDSIWWSSCNEAVCINPVQFKNKIIKEHFRGTKFESFARKLRRWGFKRIIDSSLPQAVQIYRHALFQKGKPELLEGMKTSKMDSRSPLKAAKLETASRSQSSVPQTSKSNDSVQQESQASVGDELYRKFLATPPSTHLSFARASQIPDETSNLATLVRLSDGLGRLRNAGGLGFAPPSIPIHGHRGHIPRPLEAPLVRPADRDLLLLYLARTRAGISPQHPTSRPCYDYRFY